jgi:hypothetical protein
MPVDVEAKVGLFAQTQKARFQMFWKRAFEFKSSNGYIPFICALQLTASGCKRDNNMSVEGYAWIYRYRNEIGMSTGEERSLLRADERA